MWPFPLLLLLLLLHSPFSVAASSSLSSSLSPQIRVVRSDPCACTTLLSYESGGVDVRPLVGCLSLDSEVFCYVQRPSECGPLAQPSSAYPGAAYLDGCASPSPPPPARRACDDPLFPWQWHLPRSRVPTAWEESGRDEEEGRRGGAGDVFLVVVDDGVDLSHPDLHVEEFLAWTEEGVAVPQPSVSVDVRHGTAVAGVAAALADNGVGGCGVAPGVRLASAALLSSPSAAVYDVAEADSLAHFLDRADVYTNSWGPVDDPSDTATMGEAYARALDDARLSGRGGKGAVVLFASGNGGRRGNSNDDPYAAHRYTIAVGAIGDDDQRTSYSEVGACTLLVAPSNGGLRGVVTADAIEDGYVDGSDATVDFGGTSAATPLVAGVAVLLLGERPDLGWRDVHALLALSARVNDPHDPAWSVNGAGRPVHPYYGFGAVDAAAALSLARGWTLLPPEARADGVALGDEASPNVTIPLLPDDGTAVLRHWKVTRPLRVETGEVLFDASHPFRGDLRVVLTSPSGTRSVLAAPSVLADAPSVPRLYTSVAFRDEPAAGTWTLSVQDVHPTHSGFVRGARLALYGHEPASPSPPPPPLLTRPHECDALHAAYEDARCCSLR